MSSVVEKNCRSTVTGVTSLVFERQVATLYIHGRKQECMAWFEPAVC